MYIPMFPSYEKFQEWFLENYVFGEKREARFHGFYIDDKTLRAIWKRFDRHDAGVKAFICSSQDTFEGFLAGAIPTPSR